jgi:hypothetical protein
VPSGACSMGSQSRSKTRGASLGVRRVQATEDSLIHADVVTESAAFEKRSLRLQRADKRAVEQQPARAVTLAALTRQRNRP